MSTLTLKGYFVRLPESEQYELWQDTMDRFGFQKDRRELVNPVISPTKPLPLDPAEQMRLEKENLQAERYCIFL